MLSSGWSLIPHGTAVTNHTRDYIASDFSYDTWHNWYLTILRWPSKLYPAVQWEWLSYDCSAPAFLPYNFCLGIHCLAHWPLKSMERHSLSLMGFGSDFKAQIIKSSPIFRVLEVLWHWSSIFSEVLSTNAQNWSQGELLVSGCPASSGSQAEHSNFVDPLTLWPMPMVRMTAEYPAPLAPRG